MENRKSRNLPSSVSRNAPEGVGTNNDAIEKAFGAGIALLYRDLECWKCIWCRVRRRTNQKDRCRNAEEFTNAGERRCGCYPRRHRRQNHAVPLQFHEEVGVVVKPKRP